MTITKRICGSAAQLACAALVAGCALQTHDARPLEPERGQAALIARAPDDPGMRAALQARGIDTSRWPLEQWDAEALTALAYELRAELAAVRAERAAADAARTTAQSRRNPGIQLGGEHHSRRENGSPWTIGLALDLALTGSSRRQARLAEADARLRESDWLLAARAWQVRTEVRDAYVKWSNASRLDAALEAELALRKQETALYDRRLELGAVGAVEPARARVREAETARDRLGAAQAVRAARGELARAVGLTTEALDRIALREAAPDPAHLAAASALQRSALNDRLDVRAALERYAAVDAQLQLEIARQVPELSIRPGYAWDQGDNRWSLGLATLLPLLNRNQGPIAEARARRDAEAARFLALQADAIAQLDAARRALDAAGSTIDEARQAVEREAALTERIERRFTAGEADRLELVAARIARSLAQRRLVEAEAVRTRALAAVEDAVQRPLETIAPAGAPPSLAEHR